MNSILGLAATVGLTVAAVAQPAAQPASRPAAPQPVSRPSVRPPAPVPGQTVQLERTIITLPDGTKVVKMVPKSSGLVGPADARARGLPETASAAANNAKTTTAPGELATPVAPELGSAPAAQLHSGGRLVRQTNANRNQTAPTLNGRAPERVAGWKPTTGGGALDANAGADDGPEMLNDGRLGDSWRASGPGHEYYGTVPDAPTDLKAADRHNGRDSVLSWQNLATDATGASIERQTKQGTEWSGALVFTVGPAVDEFIDPAGAGTYRYRVIATNRVGSSDPTAWSEVSVEAIAPSAPTNFVASGTTPRLTWTDTSFNETGFEINREFKSGTAWGDASTFAIRADSTDYTEWPGAGDFRYRVRAFNDVGASAWTAWSEVTARETPPDGAPANLRAVPGGDGVHATLTWDDQVSNELKFEIQRQKQSGSTWGTVTTLNADANSESYTDAPTHGTFRYRVRASNTAGASAYTAYVPVTVDAAVPPPPSGIQASLLASLTQNRVTWTDHALNESNFEMQRQTQGTDGTWGADKNFRYAANVTTVTDASGLGTFRYRARATNVAGASDWTDWAIPNGSDVPPAAPSLLTATDLGNASEVRCTWKDNASNEDGFELVREKQNGSTWIEPQTFSISANTLSFIDSPGLGTFHYRIRAVNGAGESSYTAWSIVTVRVNPPAAPTNLTLSDMGNGAQVDVSWWDNSNNEVNFELVREKQSGTSWVNAVTMKPPANETVYVDSPGQGTFRYKIRAVNSAGGSAYTPPQQITIQSGTPNPPTNLTASDMGNTKALVAWKDNSTNESGFQLERTPPFLNGQAMVNLEAGVEGYVDSCGPGTFQYRVRAYNANGPSAFAGPVSVTVADVPPDAPSGLSLADLGNESQVRATWADNSDNEASFTLERETASGSAWVNAKSFSVAKNTTTYTDNPGTGTHRYRVRSVNTVGSSAPTEWATITVAGGWTQFSPAVDTRIIYVSSSTGNNANDGLSEGKAVKTVAKGIELIRHGYPDWLLLKRGDTFNEGFGHFKKCGRSATEMMLLSTYGTNPERPKLLVTNGMGIEMSGGSGSPAYFAHLAIVGLHFEAVNRTGAEQYSGIAYLRKGENILVEDCVVKGFKDNFNLQGIPDKFKNFRIRRSLVLDSYQKADQGHSQGVYAYNFESLTIEECFFDHNGWNNSVSGAEATMFNHNIYLAEPVGTVSIRRNIITRASSHGISANMASTIEDNVVVQNAVGIYCRTAPTTVRGNVVLESRDITSADTRGFGIIVGSQFNRDPIVPSGPGLIENNIVANKTSTGVNSAIEIHSNKVPNTTTVTVQNNIVYNWRCVNLEIINASGTTQYDDQTFRNNVFVEPNYQAYLYVYNPAQFYQSRMHYSNNRYHSGYSTGRWWQAPLGTELNFDQWKALSGEATAKKENVRFKNPNVSVANYMGSLGKTATMDAFVTEMRKQSRFNWRAEFQADAMLRYFRDGFTEQP